MIYSRDEQEWTSLENKKVRGFLRMHYNKTAGLLDTMRCMVYLERDAEKAENVIENKAW